MVCASRAHRLDRPFRVRAFSPPRILSGRAIFSATRSRPRMLLGVATLAFVLGACPVPPARAAVDPALGLIENRGQLDSAVRYYARGRSATVYLTDSTAVIDLTQRGHVLALHFAGASHVPGARVQIEPVGLQPTTFNYFIGHSDHWRSNIPQYQEVIYHDLWPGWNLRLHLEGGALCYEAVASSRKPRSIDGALAMSPAETPQVEPRFVYEGAERVTQSADGSRRIELPSGVLVDSPSSSDQLRRTLRWAWVELPPSESRNDPTRLSWCTLIGGGGNDYSRGLVLDSVGRPIIMGYTTSRYFPTTAGAYDNTLADGYDAFVSKFDLTGSTLIWSTYIGGGLEDRPMTFVLDHQENPVIAGLTFSSDFPVTPMAYDRTLSGDRDAFVCKLNSTGSQLLWSTYLGGNGIERIYGLALDSSECPVVGGETSSLDFPVTPGAFQPNCGGSMDGFVSKLDAAGRSLLSSTYLGGTSSDWIFYLVLDSQQRAVVVGPSYSGNFPTTSGAFQERFAGFGDAFVSKVDLDANSLVYSTFLGGGGNDDALELALQPGGQPVVVGHTTSDDFPTTPDAWSRTLNGPADVWVAQLDSVGSSLEWSTLVGGNDYDAGFTIVLDSYGNPIISGETQSVDYPTTPDAYDRTEHGERDAFITYIIGSGHALHWSSLIGGSTYDAGWQLSLDSAGQPVLTGPTRSTDFPTTPGAFDRDYNGGNEDAWVARFDIPPVSTVGNIPEAVRPSTALRVDPVPFRESMNISVDLRRSQAVNLRLYDLSGRLVSELPRGILPAGAHRFNWDGRNAAGDRLTPGVYWVRLNGAAGETSAKVVCVR